MIWLYWLQDQASHVVTWNINPDHEMGIAELTRHLWPF